MSRQAFLACLLLTACAGDPEPLGLLTFDDLQMDVGDPQEPGVVHRPIAVGSVIEMAVRETVSGRRLKPVEVRVDEDRISVVQIDPTIVLRALEVGVTTVTVEAEDGTIDHLPLDVREIGRVDLRASRDARWFDPYVPKGFEHQGFAVRPGESVGLGARLFDAYEERLRGYDVLTYAAGNGLELRSALTLDNAVIATGTGGNIFGDIEVITDLGGRAVVRLLSPDDPVLLTMLIPGESLTEIAGVFEVMEGASFVEMVVTDEVGRVVVVRDEAAPAVRVVEGGPPNLMSMEPYAYDVEGFPIRFCPGEGVVWIEHGGARTVLELTVLDTAGDTLACTLE